MSICKIIQKPIAKLFYRKPKTLGEGLKRIVCKAGNTKDATLISAVPGERLYSNGVNIYSTNVLNQRKSVFRNTYEYATYVLKKPWRKGVTQDSIYAVKGKQTFYSPKTDFKVKDGYSIDKAIGNEEKMYITHFNGLKHTEDLTKHPGERILKFLYANAFM